MLIYEETLFSRLLSHKDITNLAISLIEKRLRDAFPSISFDVEGTPKDLASATDLALRDKYQFQWWACGLVGAQPYQGKKKGSDGGIGGLIFFQDDAEGAKKIIVPVKGGENVSVAMVRDLVRYTRTRKSGDRHLRNAHRPDKTNGNRSSQRRVLRIPRRQELPEDTDFDDRRTHQQNQTSRIPRPNQRRLNLQESTEGEEG